MGLEMRPQHIRVSRLVRTTRKRSGRRRQPYRPRGPRLGSSIGQAGGTGVALLDEVFGTGDEVPIRVGFVGELARGVPAFAELAPAADMGDRYQTIALEKRKPSRYKMRRQRVPISSIAGQPCRTSPILRQSALVDQGERDRRPIRRACPCLFDLVLRGIDPGRRYQLRLARLGTVGSNAYQCCGWIQLSTGKRIRRPAVEPRARGSHRRKEQIQLGKAPCRIVQVPDMLDTSLENPDVEPSRATAISWMTASPRGMTL